MSAPTTSTMSVTNSDANARRIVVAISTGILLPTLEVVFSVV